MHESFCYLRGKGHIKNIDQKIFVKPTMPLFFARNFDILKENPQTWRKKLEVKGKSFFKKWDETGDLAFGG